MSQLPFTTKRLLFFNVYESPHIRLVKKPTGTTTGGQAVKTKPPHASHSNFIDLFWRTEAKIFLPMWMMVQTLLAVSSDSEGVKCGTLCCIQLWIGMEMNYLTMSFCSPFRGADTHTRYDITQRFLSILHLICCTT